LAIVRRMAAEVATLSVPTIATFHGIVIRMFYREHDPAHFHADHAGQRATFDFEGEAVAGGIRSRKARQRIRRWALLHRDELQANWEKMKAGQALEIIEPLVEDN
jgi:hypothetical protein